MRIAMLKTAKYLVCSILALNLVCTTPVMSAVNCDEAPDSAVTMTMAES